MKKKLTEISDFELRKEKMTAPLIYMDGKLTSNVIKNSSIHLIQNKSSFYKSNGQFVGLYYKPLSQV